MSSEADRDAKRRGGDDISQALPRSPPPEKDGDRVLRRRARADRTEPAQLSDNVMGERHCEV